jgi:signal transduction histidine kinase
MAYRMLSFRKKILLSDCLLFLIFIGCLFPFAEHVMNYIVKKSLHKRASAVIDRINQEPHLDGVYEYLRSENAFLFFRVSLFDQSGEILYDTPLPELLGWPLLEKESPEVFEALKAGSGYSNRYCPTFRQVISYAAFPLDIQGREYVLRIGLPCGTLRALTHDFEIVFLILGGVVLFLYSIVTWVIVQRWSLPIEQMIDGLEIGKPVQIGGEFGKLAHTLNSLNARIQQQITHLVAQKEETEAILGSLGEGVIAIDNVGKITFVNSAACSMLRIEQEGVIQQIFSELKTEGNQLIRKCQELVQVAREQSERVVKTVHLEGNYFDVIVAPRVQKGGMILVLQDKTSDYRVIEMGKDFIANASHELRTPITVILGFAETLHDCPQLSQEQVAGITERIVKTSLRLNNLVKSLLTLADIEELHEEGLHPVDLTLICQNCRTLLLSAHPHVDLTLHKKNEKTVLRADGDLLEMAIMNLLQNAVKYSPSPAHIELVLEEGIDQMKVIIRDKGIGISENDLPHIFDRFYTVNKARSRKFGGTGLGLSIVKAIVQKHRGSIEAASQLGQGTTFSIILPTKS